MQDLLETATHLGAPKESPQVYKRSGIIWMLISHHCVDFSSDIRDLDKWSARMREPFEKVYGKEYFKKHWNMWIDSFSAYLSKGSGMFYSGAPPFISKFYNIQ